MSKYLKVWEIEVIVTLTKETINKMSVRRHSIHPLPPPQVSEWLQGAVAREVGLYL